MKRIAVSLLALAVPSLALAQDPLGEPPPGVPPVEDPEGGEGPIDEPEIPDAPGAAEAITADDLEGTVEKSTTPRYTKKTYPIEVIKRPLTLAAGQAEISLDVPVAGLGLEKAEGGPLLWQVLRASYGITRDIEAGITYGFGTLALNKPDGAKTYEPGKGFSFDGAYTILPGHLAVTMSVPFWADGDAFGMGFNLGVPFRYAFNDKIAVFGGADLLQLKVVKMPVDPANPGYNIALVYASQVNAPFPDGNVAFNLGAMYQAKPNLNLYSLFGVAFPDFSDKDAPYPLFVGATWSRGRKLDLGGRLGAARLDEFSKSLSLVITAAYRL